MKEKRAINITISNLDDLNSVLNALDNLFKSLLLYYVDKGEDKNIEILVLSASVYFGTLLKGLGYDENNLGDIIK